MSTITRTHPGLPAHLAQPADPALLPTQDAEDLRAAVRAVLAARCEPTAVIACYDGDRSVVTALWQALSVDLGLAGLLVEEEYGGHGATPREAAVVLEELGAAVAPVPFLTSSVLATTVLTASGDASGECAELLAGLAAGEQVAALVLPWSTGPGAATTVALEETGGEVRSVAGATEADVLLVPARAGRAGDAEERIEVRAVPVDSAEITAVSSLDMTRQLADVRISAGALAAAPVVVADAAAPIEDALVLAGALLAAEQAGLARWCVTTTLAYLKERRQFGRVLGGFQALKHRLADLYVAAEQAGAAASWAAATASEPDAGTAEVRLAAAVASSYGSRVAVRAAEETVQLHAGIAMTWEHPAHLALKRAKSSQIALGTPEHHHHRVAVLVDLPGPATD